MLQHGGVATVVKDWSRECKRSINSNSLQVTLIKTMPTVTAKFVVSRWAFCKLLRDFGFFCSVNHLSGGGVMQITTQRARKLLRPLAIPTRRERETFEQTLHKVEELRLVA